MLNEYVGKTLVIQPPMYDNYTVKRVHNKLVLMPGRLPISVGDVLEVLIRVEKSPDQTVRIENRANFVRGKETTLLNHAQPDRPIWRNCTVESYQHALYIRGCGEFLELQPGMRIRKEQE